MAGVLREILTSDRLAVSEKFDESWYPGETLVTNALVEQDSQTTLTLTILYVSREARDAVLESGTEKGVATSYDRLAELLASTHTGNVK